MQKRDLFRNLVVMAASDGSLTQSEIALLSDRAKRWDIDDSEFGNMIEFALSPDSHVDVPPSREARERLLRELIHIMAADGRLADPEKRIFATVAAVMDFSEDELNAIIDETLAAARSYREQP